GRSTNPPIYLSAYGKTYGTTADGEGDFYFKVHPDVKRIAVLLASGNNSNLRIRSFSIFALDGHASCWPGYEEIVPGANIGIAAPAAGTWERGRRVYNAT